MAPGSVHLLLSHFRREEGDRPIHLRRGPRMQSLPLCMTRRPLAGAVEHVGGERGEVDDPALRRVAVVAARPCKT